MTKRPFYAQSFRLALRLALTALPLCFASAAARAQQLSIGSYHLQGSTRSSLTQYDYTYTADVNDRGPGANNVRGTVASSSPNTLVVKSGVDFGSVPGSGTVTSTDTFVIRQDRRFAFDAGSLSWSFTGDSTGLSSGTVTRTDNPQVARYTVTLDAPGTVTVNFGTDTTYGLKTWTQSSAGGGPVTILVAGMRGNTTYHLQATVQFAGGLTAKDVDHTFTTGAAPTLAPLSVTVTPGLVPQPGVEQLTMINGPFLGVAVTDLQANVIWSYTVPGDVGGYTIEGAKLLPNGHFIFSIGNGSQSVLTTAPHDLVAIREVDLAGNVIHDITTATLSSQLQSIGYPLDLLEFHHEVTPLPNGHLLVLANVLKSFTDLPGYPGVTKVLGDVVVDLDTNMRPVWVWNEFDHLDVNRHPLSFPDWTHSNAVVYSPDDGNILVSIRHQHWVVKVNYKDGTGGGDILWRLGKDGDFALINGTDPTDWQYAQHYPSFFSDNTSGVFSLGLMDNGNSRSFPTGVVCDRPEAPPCQYTTIPVFKVDEAQRTATLTFHQILPPSLFSFFGGNTERLANGNVEYDLAGTGASNSDVFEVTQTSNPQTVWHLHSSGANAYRAFRIPSLYPGVQW